MGFFLAPVIAEGIEGTMASATERGRLAWSMWWEGVLDDLEGFGTEQVLLL